MADLEDVDAGICRLTKLRGFDPDGEMFEIHDFFTFEEAKASLFDSTRTKPIPVILKHDTDNEGKIAVVIDLIKPIYHPDLIGQEDYPDWYFEGWVVPSGYAPDMVFRRVRMSVYTLDGGEFGDSDYLRLQWIDEPTSATLPLDASLKKLGLKGRMYTLLLYREIETIGDVIEFAKRHEFSEIQGFGPTLQATLKKKMKQAGYNLP